MVRTPLANSTIIFSLCPIKNNNKKHTNKKTSAISHNKTEWINTQAAELSKYLQNALFIRTSVLLT